MLDACWSLMCRWNQVFPSHILRAGYEASSREVVVWSVVAPLRRVWAYICISSQTCSSEIFADHYYVYLCDNLCSKGWEEKKKVTENITMQRGDYRSWKRDIWLFLNTHHTHTAMLHTMSRSCLCYVVVCTRYAALRDILSSFQRPNLGQAPPAKRTEKRGCDEMKMIKSYELNCELTSRFIRCGVPMNFLSLVYDVLCYGSGRPYTDWRCTGEIIPIATTIIWLTGPVSCRLNCFQLVRKITKCFTQWQLALATWV